MLHRRQPLIYNMQSSLIAKSERQEEVWTSERCYIREILNSPKEPQVSLAICRIEPGMTTQLHCLAVAEWYVITTGEGLMEVDGGPGFTVEAGDSVAIPVGISQRITNTGSQDLLFECICLPRFYPECYQSLESENISTI